MLLLLVSTTLLWMLLPFAPAFVELRRRRDAEPLPIGDRYPYDVRHSPHDFAAYVRYHLDELLHHCRVTGRAIQGEIPDGTRFRVTATRTLPPADAEDAPDFWITLAPCTPAEGMHAAQPVYADAVVESRPGCTFEGLYGTQHVSLAAGNTVRAWLHGRKNVYVGRGSALHGSASSDALMHVAEDTTFERLHAPLIVLGPQAPAPTPTYPHPSSLHAFEPQGTHDEASRRVLVHGDLDVPPYAWIRSDVVATGTIRLGRGARVDGSLKGQGSINAEADVVVAGSVFSDQGIHLGPGCRIAGPVAAEGALVLEADCHIGTPARQTTATGAEVTVGRAVRIHGTLWATHAGHVLAA